MTRRELSLLCWGVALCAAGWMALQCWMAAAGALVVR